MEYTGKKGITLREAQTWRRGTEGIALGLKNGSLRIPCNFPDTPFKFPVPLSREFAKIAS